MKLNSTLLTLILSVIYFQLIGQSGELNTDFGEDGYVNTLNFEGRWSYEDLLIDQDTIIAVGFDEDELVVAKYNKVSGDPIEGFGDNGILKFSFDNQPTIGQSIEMQHDDTYMIGGRTGTSLLLMNLNKDGSLNTSFGLDGYVIGEDYSTIQAVHEMTIMSDGKIVFITKKNTVTCYNPDGSVDFGFGDSLGQIAFDMGQVGRLTSLVIDQEDNIYIGGSITDSFHLESTAYITKLNKTGNLDLTYATNGEFIYRPDELRVVDVFALKLTDDNELVVGGNTINLDNKLLPMLMQVNPEGLIDVSFGQEGFVDFLVPVDDGEPARISIYDIETTDAGDIILGGIQWLLPTKFVLSRVSQIGNQDLNFGENGFGIHIKQDQYNSLQDLKLDDNFIYISGFSQPEYGEPVKAVLGCFFMSGTTSLQDTDASHHEVTFYPNPTQDYIHIMPPQSDVELKSVELLDNTGRCIIKFNDHDFKTETRLSIPRDVNSGTYLLKFTTVDNKIEISKLMIQK